MPFLRAKRSQVVSAFGGGRGCARWRILASTLIVEGKNYVGIGVGWGYGGVDRRVTFSRGNGVLMEGRESRTPEGVEVMGQVLRSWFRSAWAPSRAVDERSSSRLPWRRRGFGSFARRRPRSKV